MPDPGKYNSESDWMAACVPIKKDEGLTQEQAVGACMGIWNNKEIEETVSLIQRVRDFFKEKPMKTVGGTKYPSSDFLVVEDPQSPSTWHLQVKKHGTPDRRLMGAAKAALTSPGGHRGNKYQGPGKQEAVAKLKRMYNSEGLEWKEIAHPFTVWKDKETGQYRWLAVYSNKWRDEDNPPEILASTAHKEFEEAVDKGDWPYPEVWLWHVPGTRFGVADFVTYDDTGFALVSGTVDKGKENVAEALTKDDDLATSHGMPVKEIERDEEDSTIITRYRSVEISPLPREAAANKHTGFEFINQEVKMAVPEYKRPWMEEHLGADGLKELDSFLADKAKELDEMNIQSKDAAEEIEEPQETAQESVEEEGAEEEVAEPKEAEAPAEEAPAYVTADEVAEAVGTILKPFMEKLEALSGLAEVVEEQAKSLKELEKGSEDKAAEIIANTPAASLYDRINSVIGSPETFVDGRTSLAKSGPKETEEGREGATPIPILNEMMDRSWNQMTQ